MYFLNSLDELDGITHMSWKDKSIEYKIANNLRCRLNMALKNRAKVGSAVQDLGCSIEDFILHIEGQFQKGMSWNNWGRDGWHLDHIIPLSAFDLTDPKQLKIACHYLNYQPLWAKDNLHKAASVDTNVDTTNIEAAILESTNTIQIKPIDKKILAKYNKAGISSYKIAALLNCSPSKVRYWLKKFGIIEITKKQNIHHCKYCNENNPNNFYKNRKARCKKCHNKMTYENQKNKRKNK